MAKNVLKRKGASNEDDDGLNYSDLDAATKIGKSWMSQTMIEVNFELTGKQREFKQYALLAFNLIGPCLLFQCYKFWS